MAESPTNLQGSDQVEDHQEGHQHDVPQPRTLWKKVYKFLVVSLVVHVVGLLIFGGFVILRNLQPEEVTFLQPPTIKRVEPKKRVYKLRVKQQQKRSSRPKVQPRLQSVRMSNIALPKIKTKIAPIKAKSQISGLAEGLGQVGLGMGAGGGIFSAFGYNVAGANRLGGHLYDLKMTPKRKGVRGRREEEKDMYPLVQDFVRGSKLKTSKWEREYYKSKKALYATFWVSPWTRADKAPAAFECSKEVKPNFIVVPYSGSFTPTQSGQFRFYGRGDDILIVRINGRIVLDGSWKKQKYSNWKSKKQDGGNYFGCGGPGIWGDLVTFTAGKAVKMDVIVGEVPGALFGFWLAIQKVGGGSPKIFSTTPLRNEERQHLIKLHSDARKFL